MELMEQESPGHVRHYVREILGRMVGLQRVVERADHGRKTLEIYRLIRMAFGAAATDMRDKVYGILGLIEDDIASQITPDYNLPESEVFAAFTRAVILGTRALHIIRRGGLNPRKGTPSWLPDIHLWSARYHKVPYFSAGSHVARAVEFSNHGKVLTCKGVQFDVIDGLSHLNDVVQPIQSGLPLDPFGFPSISTENAYGDRVQLSVALWRTLISFDAPPAWSCPPESMNLLNIPWGRDNTQSSGWGQLSTRSCYQRFEGFRQKNKSFRIAGIPFQDFFSSSSIEPENLTGIEQGLERFVNYFRAWKLMTTSRGYVGRGPRDARPGDSICVLQGCCGPMVLRPIGNSFVVVGPCYVSGIMQGEALDMAARRKLELVDIKIR
jgi:hypothetical protein